MENHIRIAPISSEVSDAPMRRFHRDPHSPLTQGGGVEISQAPSDREVGLFHDWDLDKTIINSVREPILLVNTDSTIERVNPATTELTGFSEGELIGQSLSILTVNNRSFQNIFTRLIQRERSGGRLETVCVRKDGSALPVVVSVSKLRGAVDRQSKVVLVAKGIGRR